MSVESYSRLEDYLTCPEMYRLKRLQKVPTATYFNAVGGKAFHSWSEDYDYGVVPSPWSSYLLTALESEQHAKGVTYDQMRISGPNDNTPNKEDYDHWRDTLGPELIKKYIKWSEGRIVATGLPPDPNGNTVGIEYTMKFTIGSVDIVAVADRIYEMPDTDHLELVDIKAGARRKTTVQIPTYMLGARKLGIPVRYGSIYRARTGRSSKPKDYARWDERLLACLYEQAAAMKQQGFFLPRPSEDCGWCSVRRSCTFAL